MRYFYRTNSIWSGRKARVDKLSQRKYAKRGYTVVVGSAAAYAFAQNAEPECEESRVAPANRESRPFICTPGPYRMPLAPPDADWNFNGWNADAGEWCNGIETNIVSRPERFFTEGWNKDPVVAFEQQRLRALDIAQCNEKRMLLEQRIA